MYPLREWQRGNLNVENIQTRAKLIDWNRFFTNITVSTRTDKYKKIVIHNGYTFSLTNNINLCKINKVTCEHQ